MALINVGGYEDLENLKDDVSNLTTAVEKITDDVSNLATAVEEITEAYKQYIKISRIGSIVYACSILPFTLVCNGATDVPKSEFPDLWAVIGTFFGPATNTTFTIPNLIDKIPWYETNQSVGKLYGSRLPNIKGTAYCVDFIESGMVTTGAFYNAGNVSSTPPADGAGQSAKLGFDAHMYNNIYADGNSFVQPPSVNLIPLIYYA